MDTTTATAPTTEPILVRASNTVGKISKDIKDFTEDHPRVTTAVTVTAGIGLFYYGIPYGLKLVGFAPSGVLKYSVAAKIHSAVSASPRLMNMFGMFQSIGAKGVSFVNTVSTAAMAEYAIANKEAVMTALGTSYEVAKQVTVTTRETTKTLKEIILVAHTTKQVVCAVGKDDDPATAARNIQRITYEAAHNAATGVSQTVKEGATKASNAVKGAARVTSEGVSQAAHSVYSATNTGLSAAANATRNMADTTVNVTKRMADTTKNVAGSTADAVAGVTVNAAVGTANMARKGYDWVVGSKP